MISPSDSILRSVTAALLILALTIAAQGCRTPPPSPFVPLGPLTDGEVLAILEERTTGVSTLYAEVEMIYDGAELHGTFDAVFHYRAPGDLRMTAFKDLVISLRPVFDLVMTRSEYGLEIAERGDEAARSERGPLEALPRSNPRFSGFYWTREAFFLPGRLGGGAASVVASTPGERRVRATLSSGASIVWILDEDTLEVRRGEVTAPGGGRFVLEYASYRRTGRLFLPGEVTFRDRDSGMAIRAFPEAIEIDVEVPEEIFDPESLGRG